MPVTNYVWDGDQYLMETDETNTTQAVFTNEPDEYTNLISQRRDGASQYAHFDAVGSTRQVTNESGTVTDDWTYDAWGNVISRIGVTEFPFQFVGMVGYYFDPETNTVYILRRIYEPEDGRWLSADPIHLETGEPPYTYVLNSPLSNIDPSGLQAELIAPLLLCAAECKEGEVRLTQISDVQIKSANERQGPGTVEHAVDALNEVTGDNRVYNWIPQKYRPGRDITSAGNAGKAAKGAVDRLIKDKGIAKHGVFIWVKVDCEECKKGFFFFSKLKWREADSRWWLCDVKPIGVDTDKYIGLYAAC